MLKLFLVTFISIGILSPSSQAEARGVRVLSFKVWKQKKINEAKAVMRRKRQEARRLRVYASDEDLREEAQKALAQSLINVDVAKELTSHDYLVLYVFPNFQGNRKAIRAAVKSLNSWQMADIISNYRSQMRRNKIEDETSYDNYVGRSL